MAGSSARIELSYSGIQNALLTSRCRGSAPGWLFARSAAWAAIFVGIQPLFDILFVGQAEMLFRRDIAQHGATEPTDHCRADTGEMVVARRDSRW